MTRTADREDPFVAFRFTIQIDGVSVGGFSECSGLQLETEVKDYTEGGLNTYVRKFVTRTKQSNITLKRGIIDRELWDWYWDLVTGTIDRRTGSIVVHDPSGKSDNLVYEFKQAFPCKWTGPELNATQNNVATETFELCHHGLQLQTLASS
jgi:phage tail-like protein